MREGLSSKRVLVVEDEYFLADDLAQALEGAGARVVGPVPTEEDALRILSSEPVDLAVIDINLQGKAGFLIADVLAARAIPFVFATGYDAAMIPERHAHVARWEKPFSMPTLVEVLSGGES